MGRLIRVGFPNAVVRVSGERVRSVVRAIEGQLAMSWFWSIVTGHRWEGTKQLKIQGTAATRRPLQGALMHRAALQSALHAVNAFCGASMRARSDISARNHYPSGPRHPASTAGARQDSPPGS